MFRVLYLTVDVFEFGGLHGRLDCVWLCLTGGFGFLYGFGVCYCASWLRFCFEFSFDLNDGLCCGKLDCVRFRVLVWCFVWMCLFVSFV